MIKKQNQRLMMVFRKCIQIPALVTFLLLPGNGVSSSVITAGYPECDGIDLLHALLMTDQDSMPGLSELRTRYFQAVDNRTEPQQIINIIKKILKLDPGSGTFWFYLGEQYKSMFAFDLAVMALNKSLELSSETGGRPMVQIYDYLGYCYHQLGAYKKELEVYEEGRSHHPDHPVLIGRQAVCQYARGRIGESDRLLSEYQSYWEARGRSEADIYYSAGALFLNTDDKRAEWYFRKALELDPGDVEKSAFLAKALILRGIKMEEAMNILQDALKKAPDNPTLLHMYGWAFFRMEEYSVARQYLSKADSLYPEYNHNLKVHLDKTEEILSVGLF